METVRPQVVAYVLHLLKTHTFATKDVFETRHGVCRLMPPLTRRLAEAQPSWAKAMVPVAEWVMQALVKPERQAAKWDGVVPTLLTGTNRIAGRDGVRRCAEADRVERAVSLPSACSDRSVHGCSH